MNDTTLTLFHGSSEIVDSPRYGFGHVHNDYGQGFYCTEEIELAREWACTDASGSWCNRYSLNMDGLRVLHLESKDYSELQWLAVLLSNREVRLISPQMQRAAQWIVDNYNVDISQYDVIVGYRADDSFFSIARAFVNNSMPLESLSEALRRGDLGLQVVLKSRKAFEHLKFINAERVDYGIYYPKRNSRSRQASEWFFNKDYSELSRGTFLSDLIRRDDESL